MTNPNFPDILDPRMTILAVAKADIVPGSYLYRQKKETILGSTPLDYGKYSVTHGKVHQMEFEIRPDDYLILRVASLLSQSVDAIEFDGQKLSRYELDKLRDRGISELPVAPDLGGVALKLDRNNDGVTLEFSRYADGYVPASIAAFALGGVTRLPGRGGAGTE